MERLRHRPGFGRRVFLYGGIAFILVGGAAAIVLNRPKPPRRRGSRPVAVAPVLLTGRVVSLARGVEVVGLQIGLQPSGRPPGAVGAGEVKTDRHGAFEVRSPYRGGPVDVFVPPEPSARWTCRPVWNVSVPATQPIEIVLIEGTAVRGRLVRAGRPVVNAPVELFPVDLGWSPIRPILRFRDGPKLETHADGKGGFSSRRASPSSARLVQTDGTGSFVFPNLPEDTEFWVYARVGSLPDQGAFAPRKLRTGADQTEHDLGDVEVRPARTLAGRVIFPDGQAPPSGYGVDVRQPYPVGGVWSKLDEKGQFELRGLPEAPVHVSVGFSSGIARRGFRLSGRNKCVSPRFPEELFGQLDRDITDLAILFEKGDPAEPSQDPTRRAAFEEASAGPITGILIGGDVPRSP